MIARAARGAGRALGGARRGLSAVQPAEVAAAVESMRGAMDAAIFGQGEFKEALGLGLLAREHVYVEGYPGTGKTLLAEVAAEASALSFYFYQLHRDTRLQELIGDTVIFRERDADGGEVIRQQNRPGGILTAEVCVLDDITRAPGEALNVLLRILNERKFGEEPLPLVMAIATGNPAGDEYYTEPLDPANVDRFTLQVRSEGLIESSDWAEAARVVAGYSGRGAGRRERTPGAVPRALFDGTVDLLAGVTATEPVLAGLMQFLIELRVQHGLCSENSLLTDRTFLVKAVRVLRAAALAAGRGATELDDLSVLRFLTRFRVPEHVHAEVPNILARIQRGEGMQDAGGHQQVLAGLQRSNPAPPPPPRPWDTEGTETWRAGLPGEEIKEFSELFKAGAFKPK